MRLSVEEAFRRYGDRVFSAAFSICRNREDAEGNTHERGGGGVAINPDGSERPLTEAEIMEHLNMPEVDYREDGSVWIYYMDQAMEITENFNPDGICFVQLKDGNDILYVTVKYQAGYAASSLGFVQPEEFNTTKPE